jgi:transcriptional regulator with XRE-family HTH domain
MTTKAENLRAMRLDKRLSQEEVAKELKVSQAHYSAIERGLKPAEVDEAQKVVSRMRLRGSRTGGGEQKVGRNKR